jgi:hypothetical protein
MTHNSESRIYTVAPNSGRPIHYESGGSGSRTLLKNVPTDSIKNILYIVRGRILHVTCRTFYITIGDHITVQNLLKRLHDKGLKTKKITAQSFVKEYFRR